MVSIIHPQDIVVEQTIADNGISSRDDDSVARKGNWKHKRVDSEESNEYDSFNVGNK